MQGLMVQHTILPAETWRSSPSIHHPAWWEKLHIATTSTILVWSKYCELNILSMSICWLSTRIRHFVFPFISYCCVMMAVMRTVFWDYRQFSEITCNHGIETTILDLVYFTKCQLIWNNTVNSNISFWLWIFQFLSHHKFLGIDKIMTF